MFELAPINWYSVAWASALSVVKSPTDPKNLDVKVLKLVPIKSIVSLVVFVTLFLLYNPKVLFIITKLLFFIPNII